MSIRMQRQINELLERMQAVEEVVFAPIDIEVKKGPGGKFFVYANDEICGTGYDDIADANDAAEAMAGSAASA